MTYIQGGDTGCISNSIAQCVNSQWDISSGSCSKSQQCFAVPSVTNSGAVSFTLLCTQIYLSILRTSSAPVRVMRFQSLKQVGLPAASQALITLRQRLPAAPMHLPLNLKLETVALVPMNPRLLPLRLQMVQTPTQISLQ